MWKKTFSHTSQTQYSPLSKFHNSTPQSVQSTPRNATSIFFSADPKMAPPGSSSSSSLDMHSSILSRPHEATELELFPAIDQTFKSTSAAAKVRRVILAGFLLLEFTPKKGRQDRSENWRNEHSGFISVAQKPALMDVRTFQGFMSLLDCFLKCLFLVGMYVTSIAVNYTWNWTGIPSAFN